MAEEPTEEDLKNMSAEEIAELQKQNCVFCKIVNKEIPAKILHEDSDVICILDINPASEGHILVYPKKHFMILPHIPEELLGKLFNTVKLMSNTLLKSVQCKGTSIFVANGMAAGQKAPHVLIHVFPRRENDGLVELKKIEISKQQNDKIISSLEPYLIKVFGGTKTKKPVEVLDKGRIVQSFAEEKKNDEIVESIEPDVTQTVRQHEPQKEKKAKKEVSLDDISKLFGA